MSARTPILLTLLTLSLTWCLSQTSQSANRSSPIGHEPSEETRIPVTALEVVSTIEVPGTPEPFIVAPFCGPDNNSVIVQVGTSAGLDNLLRISSDGKNVTRFSPSNVTDLREPVFGSFFVAESGVYILATSKTRQSDRTRFRTPQGEIVTQPAYSGERSYVVHFHFDGTYEGAIALDIPFQPLQIGVFSSGGFLAAGRRVDKSHGPVTALIKPDGRFDRFLTIGGDIHAAKEGTPTSEDVAGLPISGANYDETLLGAEGASNIVPDGRNLLLVRSGQKVPIFSISPGGEVRAVTPQLPSGFTLFDLRPARDRWIALCTRPRTEDPKDKSIILETYALSPETGKALTSYTYPSFLGFGLACSDGFEFTLLGRQEKDLQLIKLIPSHRSSSDK